MTIGGGPGPGSSAAVTVDRVGASTSSLPRRTVVDFWLDLLLVVAFTFDYSFRFTGLTIHEWIGMVFVVLVPVHLTQHWDWVVRTTRRLVARWRTPSRESLRWAVDLLLLGAFVLCVASGLLVSQKALPALGLRPGDDNFWRGLHTTTADVSVALTALHVALSWRWGLTVAKRLFRRKAAA